MKVTKLDDRWAVGLLLVATAFFRLTQNMAATTLSLLGRDELHLSARTIGTIGAIIGLGVAGVTIGVSGRIVPRRAAGSAAVGMVLLFASLITFALATSLPALLVAGVLLAVAGGVTMPGVGQCPAGRNTVKPRPDHRPVYRLAEYQPGGRAVA